MSENFGIDTTSKGESPSYDPTLDSNASELIDNLFAQLEQQLQEHSSSATGVSATPAADLHSTQTLGALTESTEVEVSYRPLETAIEPYDNLWQPSADEAIGIGNPQDSKFSQRLFFCLAFTSISAVAVWIGSQLNPRPADSVIAAAPAPAQTTNANPNDVRFAAKMTKSLQQISQKESSKPATLPKVQPSPQVANQPQTKPGLATLSAAQATAPKLPDILPTNTTVARLPVKKEPLPKLLPVQAAPQKAAPTTASPSSSELPKVQSDVQAAANAPQVVAAQPAKPAPLTTVSKASQTLVGVMELGEQSMALVANNGATRQVKIGEVMNEGGWVLMAIENGQAIIKRGGQVRALDPEQKF